MSSNFYLNENTISIHMTYVDNDILNGYMEFALNYFVFGRESQKLNRNKN